MDPLNVSVEECAHLLGYGLTLTKQLIRTGAILSYSEGRRRVVPVADIRRYQAERVAEAKAELEADEERQRALDAIRFQPRRKTGS
jgi:hypothetical protein